MFVGPPFHVMPFASLIDYQTVGLIFNVTGPRPWLDSHQEPQNDTLPLTLDAPGSPQLQALEVGRSGMKLVAMMLLIRTRAMLQTVKEHHASCALTGQ